MTNATRTVHFKIYRYDPDKDAKPYMQEIGRASCRERV